MGAVREELIYTGGREKGIKVGYREYRAVQNPYPPIAETFHLFRASSMMAAQAFYQELEYDLSVSRDVSFRGYKIEVIEANNNSIKYRIVGE